MARHPKSTVSGRILSRTRRVASLSLGALVLAAAALAAEGGQKSAISAVSVNRPFFDPSLDQKIGISVDLGSSGNLDLLILDRDGYLIRKLVSDKAVLKGRTSFDWDGRDELGVVVPDEAYSLKIDLRSEGKTAIYFPAKSSAKELGIKDAYYDRTGAVLAYKLPFASRVHVQAGTATMNPKTHEAGGPVLKTVVNREPRPAGSVIENWNGYDESRTIYVPDAPYFVIAIAITSLPENAILTSGNRSETFLVRAATRIGRSLLPAPPVEHAHHRGLTALEDASPRLKALPVNATWSASERAWQPAGKGIKVSLTLEGESAQAFAQQPAELFVFVDRAKVLTVAKPRVGDIFSVPLDRLSPGAHVVAVNWTSSYGPTAVDAFRIAIGRPSSLQPASFK